MAPTRPLHFATAALSFCLFALLIYHFYHKDDTIRASVGVQLRRTKHRHFDVVGKTEFRSDFKDLKQLLDKTLVQRNELSKQLNMKQQRLGQLECEKKPGVATSDTGGWCRRSSTEKGGQHQTDVALVDTLATLFQGKSVASFGDGPGRYKQLLLATGKLKSYDAYDGAPFADTTSEGRVKFLDLTLRQYGLPLYDWVISLEVAEHIPRQFESMFIDNIVRHAREGVVLSWAIPGQGGFSHVNNRPVQYVKELMEGLGFKHDPEWSDKLKGAATLFWLRGNTNVYRRTDGINATALEREA